MTKIAFVKPMLEVDAIWDPIRTAMFVGTWYLASAMKKLGHEVWYLDEAVRDDGLQKKSLFWRTIAGDRMWEQPETTKTPEQVQQQKMLDIRTMTSEQFTLKYSAFKSSDRIERLMLRIGNSELETLARLEEIQPDVVGIPLIATANYLPATRLAAAIKARFPRVKIVFGGQHISAGPEKFLADNPCVDQVITGDAITAMAGVVDGSVKDRIVKGGFVGFEAFPMLDYELIADTGYPRRPTYCKNTDGRLSVDYMFTRGCYRRCDFCVAGCTKTYVTALAYDVLDRQLAHFAKHGVQELIIEDDAFLWDKRHVETHLPAVLTAMKKYGMYWQNQGGVDFESLTDFVTDQIIAYNQSGEGRCTALYIPFNPRGWNKNQSASASMTGRYHHLENLKRLRAAGVYICTSTIVGTPDQTPEAFNEELLADQALLQNGYLDVALPLSATMLPGTTWFEANGHQIVNKLDYAGYSLFATHHRTNDFSPSDVERKIAEWVQTLSPVQRALCWQTAFSDDRG